MAEARYYKGKGDWTKVILPDSDRDNKRAAVIEKAEKEATEAGGEESAKDYRAIEKFFLSGEAKVSPDITLKAKNTVRLSGLGKYINGLYYVEKVKRVWGVSGFSQTIEVSRNAVGDYIKRGMVTETTPSPKVNTTRENPREEKTSKIQQRLHTIIKGDTLSKLALKYYGDASQYTKIAKANNIKPSEYLNLQIGRSLIIP